MTTQQVVQLIAQVTAGTSGSVPATQVSPPRGAPPAPPDKTRTQAPEPGTRHSSLPSALESAQPSPIEAGQAAFDSESKTVTELAAPLPGSRGKWLALAATVLVGLGGVLALYGRTPPEPGPTTVPKPSPEVPTTTAPDAPTGVLPDASVPPPPEVQDAGPAQGPPEVQDSHAAQVPPHPEVAAPTVPDAPLPSPARPATPRTPSAPKLVGKGTLELRVRPYGSISVDGKPVGVTPLPPLSLSVGRHTVQVLNPKTNKTTVRTVDIKPGRTEVLMINLNLNEG